MSTCSKKNVWDQVERGLRSIGVATIDLPEPSEHLHDVAFTTARTALDVVKSSPSLTQWIPVGADSAHATGYHTAGGENSLSRYNNHREGFVFSDGKSLDVETVPEYKDHMRLLENSLHDIADRVLEAIEQHLGVPHGWFDNNLGPRVSASQFHVKRYVIESADENEDLVNSEKILLPMHTDPSLISVVVLDARGRHPSAKGLQYFSLREKSWIDVPWHGHRVAIVFVGSVLSYLSGNYYRAVKHRVVQETGNRRARQRVAATLFVRPRPSAVLKPPPSDKFEDKIQTPKPISFDAWIGRVSKNYSKGKPGK